MIKNGFYDIKQPRNKTVCKALLKMFFFIISLESTEFVQWICNNVTRQFRIIEKTFIDGMCIFKFLLTVCIYSNFNFVWDVTVTKMSTGYSFKWFCLKNSKR